MLRHSENMLQGSMEESFVLNETYKGVVIDSIDGWVIETESYSTSTKCTVTMFLLYSKTKGIGYKSVQNLELPFFIELKFLIESNCDMFA